MVTPEEREAADKAYRNALMLAKLEHDAILPELNKLQSRVANLRVVIKGTSNLLGVGVEEQYQFRSPAPIIHGRR